MKSEFIEKTFVYARKDPGYFFSHMIRKALSEECYDVGIGLGKYALAKKDLLRNGEVANIVSCLINCYLAVGMRDKAIALIYAHEDLIFVNKELTRQFLHFCDSIKADDVKFMEKFDYDQGAFLLAAACMSEEFLLSRHGEFGSYFKKYPDFNLFLFNVFYKCGSEDNEKTNGLCVEFLRRFFSVSKVDKFISTDLRRDNIFESFEFAPKKGIKFRKEPLVSVVMSSYQARETIGYAVASILNQSYKNLELLICEDSDDLSSIELVRNRFGGDNRIRFFRSKKRQGTYNIRNEMIGVAKGDFIAFQDADDYSLPSRLAHQYACTLHNNAVAVVTNWVRVTEAGEFVQFRDGLFSRMSSVSLFAKREVFDELGPFRSVMFGGDSEYIKRIELKFGRRALWRSSKPFLLGLWSNRSMTRAPGLEALEDGYRSPARRAYAEIVMRNALTNGLIDEAVDGVMKSKKIWIDPAGVTPL